MVQPVKPMAVPLDAVVASSKDRTGAQAIKAPSRQLATKGEVTEPRAHVSASREQVLEAAEQVNAHLRKIPTALQFRVDAETDRIVVKVVNSETDEVIRQMPSEEALAIAKALKESMAASGLLINKKA